MFLLLLDLKSSIAMEMNSIEHLYAEGEKDEAFIEYFNIMYEKFPNIPLDKYKKEEIFIIFQEIIKNDKKRNPSKRQSLKAVMKGFRKFVTERVDTHNFPEKFGKGKYKADVSGDLKDHSIEFNAPFHIQKFMELYIHPIVKEETLQFSSGIDQIDHPIEAIPVPQHSIVVAPINVPLLTVNIVDCVAVYLSGPYGHFLFHYDRNNNITDLEQNLEKFIEKYVFINLRDELISEINNDIKDELIQKIKEIEEKEKINNIQHFNYEFRETIIPYFKEKHKNNSKKLEELESLVIKNINQENIITQKIEEVTRIINCSLSTGHPSTHLLQIYNSLLKKFSKIKVYIKNPKKFLSNREFKEGPLIYIKDRDEQIKQAFMHFYYNQGNIHPILSTQQDLTMLLSEKIFLPGKDFKVKEKLDELIQNAEKNYSPEMAQKLKSFQEGCLIYTHNYAYSDVGFYNLDNDAFYFNGY